MQSQKQFIYSVMKDSMQHLNAEQVIALARAEKPGIAVGTVYRNLSALCAEGKLRCVEIPGAPAIYDTTLTPHEHLVCRRCGKLRDVTLPLELLPMLSVATGEEITDYSLTIGYVCEECRKKEQE